MTFNIKQSTDIEQKYNLGLLPQRNNQDLFYMESSCRSNLSDLALNSENRRILRKTDVFSYKLLPIYYNIDVQKQIFSWLKVLNWDFPISSVKTVFTNHIFNNLYVWEMDNKIVAYSVCYFSQKISHIGYVFYDPELSHGDLPIRLVLQFIIDSAAKKLDYAYLGRFSATTGYYKRTMPGFEYYQDNKWIKYKK
jgi:hypothetical protein